MTWVQTSVELLFHFYVKIIPILCLLLFWLHTLDMHILPDIRSAYKSTVWIYEDFCLIIDSAFYKDSIAICSYNSLHYCTVITSNALKMLLRMILMEQHSSLINHRFMRIGCCTQLWLVVILDGKMNCNVRVEQFIISQSLIDDIMSIIQRKLLHDPPWQIHTQLYLWLLIW